MLGHLLLAAPISAGHRVALPQCALEVAMHAPACDAIVAEALDAATSLAGRGCLIVGAASAALCVQNLPDSCAPPHMLVGRSATQMSASHATSALQWQRVFHAKMARVLATRTTASPQAPPTAQSKCGRDPCLEGGRPPPKLFLCVAVRKCRQCREHAALSRLRCGGGAVVPPILEVGRGACCWHCDSRRRRAVQCQRGSSSGGALGTPLSRLSLPTRNICVRAAFEPMPLPVPQRQSL